MLLQRIDYHIVAQTLFHNVSTSEKSDNSAVQIRFLSAFSFNATSHLFHAVRFAWREGLTKKNTAILWINKNFSISLHLECTEVTV